MEVDENESVDEDIGSSAEELDSGDEEVLCSVPVDLPPRSSTSPPVPAPSVPAPSAPSPCPAPVPMDSAHQFRASSPRWIKRLPGYLQSECAHLSNDAHTGAEDYTSGALDVALILILVVLPIEF